MKMPTLALVVVAVDLCTIITTIIHMYYVVWVMGAPPLRGTITFHHRE
jgi:hypothetical protein